METIEFVLPGNEDARALISTLNLALSQLTGNSDQGSRFERNFDPEKDAFLLITLDKEPVACGGLRYIDRSRCELKRVFSTKKGYGSKVLSALEARAKEIGYQEVLIVTRRVNGEAIRFYLKHGYVETELPQKYSDPERSICLNKIL